MKIETIQKNNRQIVAEVDNDDNSLDIAIMIEGESVVSLNISVDDDKILIRKWIGYGDSDDEPIYINDLYEE